MHDKHCIVEEPDEGKLSRPVLKPSGARRLSPLRQQVYEGSGVEMSDQGVLNLRWIAEAYLWRETGSWNGVNSTGTLRKLSRWPAACSVGVGLLQKPMLRVMSEIRRREHGGVKDKAVNSGKKVMNQPKRLGINVIKFIGRSWRNWWLSCKSGVIKLRIG